MKTSQKGIDLIKKYEGYQPTVYICPAGKETIGYGHVVKTGESFRAITQKDAEDILKDDLVIAEKSVMNLIKAPLQQEHFDALVSFTFNLGAGNLEKSTLRSKINRLEYEAAPAEFNKWCFVGSKKLAGLILRRKEEADLFQLGTKTLGNIRNS